ncbi:hypothetical protein CRE_26852 [Caenorhabditis remanei]|uniref:Serpin domain-containing protein n=1 Tax=Caenorhabditis remanei TaxID=31234 RepID=E3NM22_CAERE|nr:hypothetical protein CRE_26852 [Caenorhabditis remanei]
MFYRVCRRKLGEWLGGSLHGVPADEAHKLGSWSNPTPSPPTTAALEKPNFKRTLSGIHDDKVVSFLLFLLLSYTKFDTGPPSLKGVISSSVKIYFESESFKILLTGTIKECMETVNKRMSILELSLRKLEDQLKLQEELKLAAESRIFSSHHHLIKVIVLATPIIELEMNLGLKLLKQSDTSDSFIVSPVSIIIGTHAFFKCASPEVRLRMAKLILEGGTPDDLTEYFIDLLSVLRATADYSEIVNLEEPSDPTIQYLYRGGQHGLEKNVFDDFLSMKLKFLEIESSSESCESTLLNTLSCFALFNHWFHTFTTFEGKFHNSPDSQRDVEYMLWDGYRQFYSENDDFQMVQLNMRRWVKLTIFVPKTRFGLANILKNLKDCEQFSGLIRKKKLVYVDVSVPKLKINTEVKLEGMMTSLGADKNLYKEVTKTVMESDEDITSLLHKSEFELNEKEDDEAEYDCGVLECYRPFNPIFSNKK